MTAPPAPGLLSVDAARDAVLAVTAPVGTERIAAAASLGRITAERVIALVSLPPWPNSAMDGYAIQAADTDAAQVDDPVELRVIGEVRAGVAPLSGSGEVPNGLCGSSQGRGEKPGRHNGKWRSGGLAV